MISASTLVSNSFVCPKAVSLILGVSPLGGALFFNASLHILKWWLALIALTAISSSSSPFLTRAFSRLELGVVAGGGRCIHVWVRTDRIQEVTNVQGH